MWEQLPMLNKPRASKGRLTRREVFQRILAGLGTVLAGPVAVRAHPMYRHLMDATNLEGAGERVADPDWSPQVLDAHQNESLIALAEGIVPGSSKAQVNRVIDLLLTVDTTENHQKFAAALAALEAESDKRFSQPIVRVTQSQMTDLLTASSTATSAQSSKDENSDNSATQAARTSPATPTIRDHFENLKGWIVATYYSSEQGMTELGWTDEFYFESPTECSHSEGHT
jgi:Gluconate 2-dehydrogenase subunit 3